MTHGASLPSGKAMFQVEPARNSRSKFITDGARNIPCQARQRACPSGSGICRPTTIPIYPHSDRTDAFGGTRQTVLKIWMTKAESPGGHLI
jgi:hypothetical protein